MAGKTTLTVGVQIAGVRETLAAFRQLPKDASDELRSASLELAQTLATAAEQAAHAEGRQAAALAGTVKASRDRVPVVQAGGPKRVGSKRAQAWTLLFGSEFGMNRRSGWFAAARYKGSIGRQYKPHRGRQGRWFFPTVDKHKDEIAQKWTQAADAIIAKFSEGG